MEDNNTNNIKMEDNNTNNIKMEEKLKEYYKTLQN